MTYKDLGLNVIDWADSRGIFENGNVVAQIGKTLEELGELLAGVSNNDPVAIKDARGDVEVTVIIINEFLERMYSESRRECLEYAWHQIKDRKGQMVNGHFVKDE